MIKHFDHVTIVVEDVEAAKQFFAFLGFEEDQSVTISGEQFSRYMRIDGIEAEHHTLALTGSAPRLEVQLQRACSRCAAPPQPSASWCSWCLGG